jgi:hypothetical protein
MMAARAEMPPSVLTDRALIPYKELLAKIMPLPNGCRLWLGTIDHDFAIILTGRRKRSVARMMWHYEVGPIPDGTPLHRQCEAGGCIAPKHHVAARQVVV